MVSIYRRNKEMNNHVNEEIEGVIVPNVTIFDREGNVDLENTEKHMRWLNEKGINNFFLTGSYGSGPLMTNNEKLGVYKAALSIKNVNLIANIGAAETNQSKEMLISANELGISKFASVVPYYYKYSDDNVLGYFDALCKETSGDVYIYNNKNTVRYDVKPEMIDRLMNCGVKGIKDSTLSLDLVNYSLFEIKNKGEFQYIAGSSTGCIGMYKMGIKAYVAGMANYAPEIVVKLFDSLKKSNADDSEMIYKEMMNINRKIKYLDSTVLCNAILRMRGFKDIFVRKPMMEVDENSKDYSFIERTMRNVYERLGYKFDIEFE